MSLTPAKTTVASDHLGLGYVRQQNQGAVSMLPQEDMELEVDPDPALEREAEEAAQQAMVDGPVVVNRMGCDVQIQRSTDTATPNNAESISELQQELADLKETVDDHDETLSEIEGAQEDVEELVEEFDGDAAAIDLDLDDGGNRSIRDRVGNALDNFNVLGGDGKQNATEGLVAGGLTGVGLLATLATGGAAAPAVDSLATATLAPALRGAAADAVVDNDTAVPNEIANQLGSALAKSEEFAKEIGSNSALAKEVADQLDNAIYEGPTGDGDSQNVGKSGEVTN